MLRKIPIFIANTVVVLTILCAFGWVVRETTKGKQWVPHRVSRSITFFTTLPDRLMVAKAAVERLPLVYVPSPENFEPVNELEQDVKVLLSYANANWKRTIAIKNLRTNKELKTWSVDRLANPHNRIMHSLMLPDSSLIYSLNGVTGLIKIDKNSERLWKQDSIAHHHAINIGADNTFWANTYGKDNGEHIYYGARFNIDGREFPFIDNTITQFDAESGRILFHKSVTEILIENDLTHLLIKSDSPGDPLHINDIQPVLQDGPKMKKGDVFISSRTSSWIMHFRPSTGKMIELIEGPFMSQHDVDIESDSTIIFFNNGGQTLKGERPSQHRLADNLIEVAPQFSGIVRYHLGIGKFEHIYPELFAENEIFSFTESLVEELSGGGYFIEEQNSSVLWVLKDGEVKYKNILNSQHEGHHHLANWGRVMP
ncbi:MAG TPA: hypothetical protein DIT65_05505 [Cryomorphaceae bacterium]|nr:hypothetical protein [Cryomorphaceae bacterium]|tara:strand:- start:813 stop:2093 length:1281 start_codon:yes stop_codon:yes gene_type:complete